jgi:glycosyltransferase involved in cell wall biosynthesis
MNEEGYSGFSKGYVNNRPQLGVIESGKRGLSELKFTTPKKGKLRILPISDSAWAPTGFGTNTKNVSAILTKEGHHIGYGGCQNPTHSKYETEWPLGQTKKTVAFENLPIMFPGQERFGEKSFIHWIKNFKPDIVWTHLDFQMFGHVAGQKSPKHATIPLYNPKGNFMNRKERTELLTKMFKEIQKGTPWKWAATIPFDGQPAIPAWQDSLRQIDYKICMSRYGQLVMEEEYTGCEESWYIPHGVDCNFFKPKLSPMYGKKPRPEGFIVGCVARNQHRKNIPRLIKGYKEFVDRNDLKPDQTKLILHMDWKDAMGWPFPQFAEYYGLGEYLLPPLMGILDAGEALEEEGMVDLYNCMDVFVLPTAGEGFGIPTIEAMACGVPVAVTNYTTAWEIIREDDPETAEFPLYPLGAFEASNGRDNLEEEDICKTGILLPYKDMWWDTPNRAAPQRALCSEMAIADALDYYYHNPDKRIAAGKAAREKAKSEYGWPVIEKRWLALAKTWEERN